MLQHEHERALRAMAARRELPAGENYLIDADTGLVTKATVWLHGDVWFFDHCDRDHPRYGGEYLYAVKRPGTLFRPRTN